MNFWQSALTRYLNITKQWPLGCCTSRESTDWCAEILTGGTGDFLQEHLESDSLCVYCCIISLVPNLMSTQSCLKCSHRVALYTWTSKIVFLKTCSHTYHHAKQQQMDTIQNVFEEGENTLLNCKMGLSQPHGVVKNLEPRLFILC